jgi:hypothetical protein
MVVMWGGVRVGSAARAGRMRSNTKIVARVKMRFIVLLLFL